MPEKPQQPNSPQADIADAPRCVCGYPKASHNPDTLECPHNPGQVYGTMNLPDGKTCADCYHFKRTCEWLISCPPTRIRCDWYPIRFRSVSPAPPTVPAAATVSQENPNADR